MPPVTLGRVFAFLVLVAAFVLGLIGRLDLIDAALFVGLSLAILVP